MKKVLFAINTLNNGGAEKVLLTLLRYLDPKKYEIHLLVVFGEGIYFEQIPQYVRVTHIFPCKSKEATKEIREHASKLYEQYVKESYDVMVAFLEGPSTKILSCCNDPMCRKYAWMHTNLKKRHRTAVFYKSFEEEKYAYSQYDKIVFVSEAIRVAFGEMFGIELVQNAAVCYNPLEAKTIRRMAEAYEVAHDKFTICAVGRVIPEKGFLRLTSICEHMVEDGRDFTLNIVGDGKEYDRLKEMVESHHLEKWEHLIGFQENPYPYIKNADLFVCSSLNEGYNLAISEAVILGVPVISTDCSGIKENLGNGKWGYIVENRKETLYHAISRCFDEPGFLEELKKKYWDARHNCYGYVLGKNNETQRFSDDGEPSGTAGKPILEVIKGNDIHNILIVVTRYFGGTLLGTGGLIRAYTKSSQDGIENASIVCKIQGIRTKIETDYNGIGKIQYIAASMGIKNIDTIYTEKVIIDITVKKEDYDGFEKKVVEATNGKAVFGEREEAEFVEGE